MGRLFGLADALRSVQVPVIELPGWRQRGGDGFNPRGIIWHHTGPYRNVDSMLSLLMHGRSDLLGPLCNLALGPDGTWYVIAAGRANHAGSGSWQGLTGNTSMLGVEAIHPGDDTPWPKRQLRSWVVGTSGLVRLLHTNTGMVCGHKEWTRRKIDPYGLDMNYYRQRIEDELRDVRPLTLTDKGVIYSMPIPEGAVRAQAPIVGGWPCGDNLQGYTLVAADGAIYAFGPGAPGYQEHGMVRFDPTEPASKLWIPGQR